MDEEFLSKNQPELDQKNTVGRFNGKLAVVTGGASGIGFATVERFINDGASVAIIDINENAGQAALKHVTVKDGQKVLFYVNDVSNREMCKDTASKISKDFDSSIHILVNCAVYFGCKALDSTEEDWTKSCHVNIAGPAFMVQAVHPYMPKDGTCSIVNLSSCASIRPHPLRWTYSATKGAITTLTRNMAFDLSADRIRVNTVYPSWVWSPEMKKASPDGTLESMKCEDYQILRRCGHTSEVAAAIAFLCSKDASFITASDFFVDGGYGVMSPEGFVDTNIFAGISSK